MNLNRRKLLLLGLGAGIASRIGDEYNRDRNFNLQRKALANTFTDDPENIINTAYNLEADWETEIAERLDTPPAEQGGFFIHPATLAKLVSKSTQRVICPEAFTPYTGAVIVCPTIPLLRMLIAALWSRHNLAPQPQE